jgi:hypothetical protein
MGAPAILLPLALAGAAGTITPSGPEVPANLLRIEVQFDRPLPAVPMQAIVLRDAAGKPIADALLDIALPDRDERRLAVLMQPGRIKHGVGPNLAVGPALHDGDRISIEIRDPRLAHPLVRAWRVGAAYEQPLVPARWHLRAPAARSKAPLVLGLPTAINASAAQLIAVADGNGRRVAGTARLGAGETEWRFVPAAPWQPGRYQVRIHSSLEDPAGNRVCAAFEARRQSALPCRDDAKVGFRIGARRLTSRGAP